MDLLDDLEAQLGVYFNYSAQALETESAAKKEPQADIIDAYQYVGR